ncbi:putative flippase GtrA [Pseudoduganella flava]|uniref:GtrA family protein n=1 Tax=Pseudoduganella flava TaxID=871742 RepID=A0A562PNX0_9BURK|nr:GtrA family protein [Pseudoduganella flava]QGZ40674.1 GtrA family protein [Pseudoduganella flava]TWI46127.1 putative flippase GtrA [Pseudoduganella flava]
MADPSTLAGARSNFSARSFLTFLCVGGISTLVHYGLMALLVHAGLPAVPASCAGFALSAVLNYLLNDWLTFRSNEDNGVTAPRFAIVALSGLLLNHLLLTLLTNAGLSIVPAQLLTTAGVILWNYCIHGAWTFGSRQS